MIKKASLSRLDEIKALTEACAIAMQQKGIFQWNEHYPSREKLEKDIKSEELFILEESGAVKGIVVLTPEMDEEYIPIKWLTPNDNNLYIHRIATHPSVWGKGYGRKLMDFAEKFASENGFTSVRLDTFSKNVRNQKFYRQRGYQRLGDIYFPKQSEFPFYCYEKIIS